MTEHHHETGKCDICHKLLTGFGLHGIIHGISEITRYCDDCWKKEEATSNE